MKYTEAKPLVLKCAAEMLPAKKSVKSCPSARSNLLPNPPDKAT